MADSCGEPSKYAGAYRLGNRKIILSFCERHFDEAADDALAPVGEQNEPGGDEEA